MNKIHPAFSTPIYKDRIRIDKNVLNPILSDIDFKRIDTKDRWHSSNYKILDNDFEDFESSYTQDGVDDTDNEDDGFEDINASEVTDSELDEIDVKDLIKGKKYRYKTPSHQDDIEFGDEHEYHDGGNMYGFRSGDTGYSLGKRGVEDFVSHLDDELFPKSAIIV